MPQRAQSKLALTRRLYGLGHTREQIQGLYRFLDWLLRLPEDLDRQVWQAIRQYEEEQHMAYITTAERFGREEGLAQGLAQGRAQGLAEGLAQGRREGLLDGIALALEIKFGAAAADLMVEIRQLEDLTTIQAIYDQIKTTTTPDEVRAIYAPPAT